MPLKTLKKDAADALTLEWILHVKNYKLALDKNRCVGCQICTQACPKQAITTTPQPKQPQQKMQKAKVDIDLAKCNFCGICDVTCPHGAITVTHNDQHDLNILAKETYPELVRDFEVDTHNCPKECDECATICPLNLITVTKTGFDGQPIKDFDALSPSQKRRVHIAIDIDKKHCPTCKVCEIKCSPGTIKVKKAFEGIISINQPKCPEGCTNCLDVCPITGTLVLGDDNKVYVNPQTCTFCGACKNVCPEPEALVVKRTKVHHTPVHSGTWNKACERLTSQQDAVKELKTLADKNRRQLVTKRFTLEENIK